MRFLAPLFLCLVLPVSALQAAPDPGQASRYVESIGQGAIEILTAKGETELRRAQRLRGLLSESFGLPVMCPSVVGEDWSRASAWDRQAFCAVFEDYLLNAVIKVLKDDTPNGIEVTAVEPRGEGDFRVTTRVTQSGSEPWSLAWMIRAQDDGFVIIDFVMGAVSLMETYRSEFDGYARREGMDALTKALERKVASGR